MAEKSSADWLLIGYIQFGSGSEEGWQGSYVGAPIYLETKFFTEWKKLKSKSDFSPAIEDALLQAHGPGQRRIEGVGDASVEGVGLCDLA